MQTDQGIKNILPDRAAVLAGTDPDYGIKDLYEAIANGNYVSMMCGPYAHVYYEWLCPRWSVWSDQPPPILENTCFPTTRSFNPFAAEDIRHMHLVFGRN